MKKKRHTPEQIIKKLRAIELMVGQGRTAAEASKVESISEQTYYTDGRSNMQGWTSSA
jgi:DNA-binding CsgD family transcriptional regulator